MSVFFVYVFKLRPYFVIIINVCVEHIKSVCCCWLMLLLLLTMKNGIRSRALSLSLFLSFHLSGEKEFSLAEIVTKIVCTKSEIVVRASRRAGRQKVTMLWSNVRSFWRWFCRSAWLCINLNSLLFSLSSSVVRPFFALPLLSSFAVLCHQCHCVVVSLFCDCSTTFSRFNVNSLILELIRTKYVP